MVTVHLGLLMVKVGFQFWGTDFSVNDKRVNIFLVGGTGYLSVKTEQTVELYKILKTLT